MLLNQSLSSDALTRNPAPRSFGGVFTATVAASLLLGGCSMLGGRDDAPAPVRSTASEPASAEDTAPTPTATEAAVAANPSDATSDAESSAKPVINRSAPMSYTVKRGDTLWDIASMYLRDPWLWPEIWQVNPQVENPHLIYPGDILSLAYGADGSPQIHLTRGDGARLNPLLRSDPLNDAIATIPYSAISAFLERPSVVSKEQLKTAPRVLSLRNEHMVGGSDNEIYARGLQNTQPSNRFSVVHVGDPIRDPDDGDILGYAGTFASTAIVQKPGDPGRALLTESARETIEGDLLLGIENEVPLNFVPRAPDVAVNGQIVSVADGASIVGQYAIVAINRGSRHGLAPGHVLAIDEAGDTVRDRAGRTFAGMKVGGAFAPKVKLPNERNGTMLVFRVYDRLSYGLIVSAQNPVRIADVVRTP